MMFGPRLNTVFASRWKALFWAASVLFSAYCFVPSQSETGEGGDDQAVQMVTAMLPGAQPSAQPSRSPWASESPKPAH